MTMNMPDLEVQLFQWIGRTPWLLVACAGIVLCMVFAGRQPRRCLMIGCALAIQLAVHAAAPFISQFVFARFDATDMSQLKWRILLSSLIYSIPNALSLGLLLWAALEPVWKTGPPDDRTR